MYTRRRQQAGDAPVSLASPGAACWTGTAFGCSSGQRHDVVNRFYIAVASESLGAVDRFLI